MRALFVCLHNAGRSQMSAALWEQAGIDLSDRTPQRLTTEAAEWAELRAIRDDIRSRIEALSKEAA
jgi:protein-tyrosine-phosphatase